MSDVRRTFKTFTLRERPELEDELERLADEGWPRVMRQRDEGRYEDPNVWMRHPL